MREAIKRFWTFCVPWGYIHVVSMDVETIAVIKKNKKIQHERMCQGNARIIVIHPFVFGLIIFLSLLVGSNGWNV